MDDFVEPGAVRHGNFINYYDFNSAPERRDLLPLDDDLWRTTTEASQQPYLVLDVGCNAGNFTQLLYEFLVQKKPNRKIIMLGVDIDPVLIERATQANQFKENVFYSCYNVMEYDDAENCIANHLKAQGKYQFDVVCCFSITMWIHLNNGDDGLLRFLDLMVQLSEILVIEPQPWSCYKNAVRRMKRAGAQDTFPLFGALKMRNDVEQSIKDYLKCKKLLAIIYESDATKWKRKICFYRKGA
ncbi:probable RNA methyltransferase CG11342 [Sitodiplosis mosellana]|uniref:probable RNA methyltransferase CG11342 n=1 Tax=Sitodiplosis mosellana TaxID=263140 RepID=UPI0024438BA3|nr:probable RNA methyltransferase CG11342 [Sitodiplosis mosellana]